MLRNIVITVNYQPVVSRPVHLMDGPTAYTLNLTPQEIEDLRLSLAVATMYGQPDVRISWEQ